MADVRIVLDTKALDRIIAHTGDVRDDAIKRVAKLIEGKAKMLVQVYDAIDTGSLRSSIHTSYTRMPELDDQAYSKRQNRVINVNAERVTLPKTEHGRGKTVAFIGPSVNYGIYVEMGTRSREQRPYMRDSVRGVDRALRRELRRLERGK